MSVNGTFSGRRAVPGAGGLEVGGGVGGTSKEEVTHRGVIMLLDRAQQDPGQST